MKKTLISISLLLILTACSVKNTNEQINNTDNIQNRNTTNNNLTNNDNTMQYPFKKFDKDIKVTIKTNKGDIKLEVYGTKAPITVGNFVYLINKGFYNGIKFHRVINDFMIQTGDPNTKGVAGKDFVYDPYNNSNNLPIAGTANAGYKFEDEFSSDLKFDKAGVLAMANSGANTNSSQIFITHLETPWLNGKHTIFGQVISGQNVVNAIEQGDEIKDIIIEN
ncbi:MAG: peptidylprolyl isomerase [Patescibacteria group bacterium]|nr:peptidylprolyl isomerase [Patescibacteria group bacterium]